MGPPRDIAESKTLYKSILQSDGKVRCVWSGDTISRYDIDHISPFTIWKNNDLWNLPPARPDLNNRKRDKIPSPALIDRQSGLITALREVIHRHSGQRFRKEMQSALLGYDTSGDWQGAAMRALKRSYEEMIGSRGFEGWEN